MTIDFDVCIRGAGIVGKTLALKLARERLRVALVDQPNYQRTTADIRAYALNHSSRALLQSLRCWPASAATAVSQMEIWGDSDGVLRFDAQSSIDSGTPMQALAWIVDVPALEEMLAKAVEFQPAIEIVSSPVAATLTAICEGKSSETRQHLGVEYASSAYPQHALATRIKSNIAHAGVARQWFTGSDILALLPLGGLQGQEFAVVWSTEPEHASELRSISEADFIAQLQAIIAQHAEAIPKDTVLEKFELVGARASWPLRLSQAQHWAGTMTTSLKCEDTAKGDLLQSWVLLGDAAHTVHPLAGSGLNLGLGDVQELAELLNQRPEWKSVGDLRLLRAYARARKSALLPFVAATDGLQQLFSRKEDFIGVARNFGMNRFDKSTMLKRWLAKQAMSLPS